MARINIEQVWWTDPRREKLANSLGSLLLADAVVIRAWKLAQDFWGDNRGLIPKHVFETLEANANLIQANLAEVREEGIYVRGSSQYLDWVAQRRDAAKRGGQKSSEKRKQNKQTPEPNASKVQPNASKLNQTQPSGSISGSISYYVEGNNTDSTFSEENKHNSSLKQEAHIRAQAFRDFFREQKLFPRLKPHIAKIAEDFGDVETLRDEMNRLAKLPVNEAKSDSEIIDFIVGTLINRAKA